MWIIGNGGSASTAEHFATDLSCIRFKKIGSFPKVEAITANSALIAAILNDLSYVGLFEVILKRKAQSGDLLISISASGNSPNVINAIMYAKRNKLRTFSLLGFYGGKAKTICDKAVVVKSNLGDMESLNMCIYQYVTR